MEMVFGKQPEEYSQSIKIKTNLIFFLIQFGESQKLRLVRILRSTVMVRVGGGWMALDEFLVKNDPCRGNFSINFKSKMNII